MQAQTTTTYRTKRKRQTAKDNSPVFIPRQKLTARMMVEEPPVTFAARRITSSTDCYNVAIGFWDMDEIAIVEHAYCLYLDRANQPICFACISIGGMAGTVVDPKVIFSHALLCGAHALCLFHNHPSGNVCPSQPDKDLTRKLIAAGRVLDIAVLDHLILTPNNGYLSFVDEGLMRC